MFTVVSRGALLRGVFRVAESVPLEEFQSLTRTVRRTGISPDPPETLGGRRRKISSSLQAFVVVARDASLLSINASSSQISSSNRSNVFSFLSRVNDHPPPMARNPAPINAPSHRRVNRSTSSVVVCGSCVPSNCSHKRRFIAKLSPTSSPTLFFFFVVVGHHRKKIPSSGPSLFRASSRVPLGRFRQVDVDDFRLFEARRVRPNTTARGARTGTRDVCKTRVLDHHHFFFSSSSSSSRPPLSKTLKPLLLLTLLCSRRRFSHC